MLKFNRVHDEEITMLELVADLTLQDLLDLTHEMVDQMLKLIADCVDADVVFQPVDPDAHDPYARSETDENLAWTLAHVIVHATASAEESAALAAGLARGVRYHGRSRYETPWETVTTIAACRQRLQESRRIRLASTQMWPDEPNLENSCRPHPKRPPIDVRSRFCLGLMHDDAHLAQIAEIVRQAHAGRA